MRSSDEGPRVSSGVPRGRPDSPEVGSERWSREGSSVVPRGRPDSPEGGSERWSREGSSVVPRFERERPDSSGVLRVRVWLKFERGRW